MNIRKIDLKKLVTLKVWKEHYGEQPPPVKFHKDIIKIAEDLTDGSEVDKKYIACFCKYDAPYIIPRYRRLKKLKKVNFTKYKCILIYGMDEGLIRYNEFCRKSAEKNTFEYKNKKTGMTKDEYNEFNKSRAITLKNQIKKYGKEEGTKKFNNYVELQKYAGSSIEYFIDLHGKEKGKQVYDDIKKSKAVTLENQIKKYGEFEGKIRYEQYRKKMANRQIPRFSNISQKLFDSIRNIFNSNDKFYYATNQGERLFWIKNQHETDKHVIFVDFLYKNVIIEFNGDIYHGNPALFNCDDTPNYYFTEKTCKEFWKEDEKRTLSLEDINYNVLVIWENEYKENPEKTIKKCVDYIKKHVKDNKLKECINDLF